MKKLSLTIIISIMLTFLLSMLWPARSFDEQLIKVQAQQMLGDSIPTIERESVELQSILLDYSADPILLLKTQVALQKYPALTRQVLLQFGADSTFRKNLHLYGEPVIPIVNYFHSTDIITTLKLRDDAGQLVEKLKNWWNETEQTPHQDLTPAQQAQYALRFIEEDGYDFLGQFHIDDDGKVEWLQTERFSESLTAFFSSGVKNLETRYAAEEEMTAEDILWAGADVLVVAGSLKVLRASRQVAKSGKSLSMTRQTSLFGSRLLKSGFAGKLFKYSSVTATGFVIIKHPSLIPSAFAEVGKLLGVPPMLAQFIGISLLLLMLVYPFAPIIKLLLRSTIKLLRWTTNLIEKLFFKEKLNVTH